MTTPEQPATGTALRGFGWDIDSPFSSNRGEFFPVGSFGHTGFTGTSIWMDPSSDTYVVFMSNAVYPNGPTGINAIRGAVANVVAAWVKLHPDNGSLIARLTGYNESIAGERLWHDRNGTVSTGIDILEARRLRRTCRAGRQAWRGFACGVCSPIRPGSMRMAAEPSTFWRKTQKKPFPDSSSSSSSARNTASTAHSIKKASRFDRRRDRAAGDQPLWAKTSGVPHRRRCASLDAVLIDLAGCRRPLLTYETVVRYFLEAAGARRARTSWSSTVPIPSEERWYRVRSPTPAAKATSMRRRFLCATA